MPVTIKRKGLEKRLGEVVRVSHRTYTGSLRKDTNGFYILENSLEEPLIKKYNLKNGDMLVSLDSYYNGRSNRPTYFEVCTK